MDSPTCITDERTSMLHEDGQFDVVSAGLTDDRFLDEPRYSTLGRQRPIVIAPPQHRDGMFYTDISYV